MKNKTFLIFIILISINFKSSGQKLKENGQDAFTNESIKRTSWESLCGSLTSNVHFRIDQVNGSNLFDMKLMLDKHFWIDQNAEMLFKLDNGDVLTLHNQDYTVTCLGCGATGLKGSEAPGIEVIYPMSKDETERLKTNKVIKVRIYTSIGYVEEDVKDKNAQKIIKSLSLLD